MVSPLLSPTPVPPNLGPIQYRFNRDAARNLCGCCSRRCGESWLLSGAEDGKKFPRHSDSIAVDGILVWRASEENEDGRGADDDPSSGLAAVQVSGDKPSKSKMGF
ncbi:unnamed protein product [Pseudo-nitzschia multistriata]|uniref:Uncharacterized protein n=1 Tax=Pseudo-nitzschia multistriata TaxID=183589 RepID=A0A448Z013_9STRA|nr:unnamed protein product [Pseudo-nitzschia multistriata]